MSDETRKTLYLDRFFSEKTSFTILIIGSIIFIVSILVFLFWGSWSFSHALDEEKVGQFGDFVGGVVGCLFALVGVILYYVALRDQRKDFKRNQEALNLQVETLNHQIIEFQEQRKELEATRAIYEQQTKTMKIQQFESNFYSFLNVYLKIKNELNSHSSIGDFFKEKYLEIANDVDLSGASILHCHNEIIDIYSAVYLNDRGRFSQYFKTIYRLMKIIDTSSLPENEKYSYGKIVRSQITDYELLILYYNYHSIYGEKAYSLILNYNTLKHIRPLSKVEFHKKYTIDKQKSNNLIFFTDWLSNLIQENIPKAYDLESELIRVSERFEKYDMIIDIEFDFVITVKCSFKINVDRSIFPFCDEVFKDFICHFLYDKLFFSQFSIPTGNEIQKSTTTTDDKIIFNFIIQLDKAIVICNDKK